MPNNYYLNYTTITYLSILNSTATISTLIINYINLFTSAPIYYYHRPNQQNTCY